jgi:hypothetical protein
VSGLLIGGLLVDVPGATVYNPADQPWCRLDPADYRRRKTKWCRQLILHSTKGKHPSYVRKGAGPGGKDKAVADFWRNDPQHSAAQIVVDTDGSIACLADLAYVAAYHATVSNDWSVGIEMYQESDGGIYEATLDATVKLVLALCDAMSIPLQIPSRVYNGRPLNRMLQGGPDVVGVLGHRDNTSRRGRGDPGDDIFYWLEKAGAEGFDFDLRQDIATWRRRQGYLNAMHRTHLEVDGVCGPATIEAMRKAGYMHGREIPA